MEIESDIVVIGGGLSGMFAALTVAKQRPDIDVTVVSKKQSTLRQASGHLDLVGYIDGRDDPVVNPYKAIHELQPGHPYRKIGVENVRGAMDLFGKVVTGYMGSHTDNNALLPVLGGLKPSYMYPASMRDGLLSDERDMLLIGFESIPDMNAELLASVLMDLDVPFNVDGFTIRSPFDVDADAEYTRHAYFLERAARGDELRLSGVVSEVRKKMRKTDFDVERIGFPAVLGYHESTNVIDELGEKLGVPVFEVALLPPSLPGMRLENELHSSMKNLGVSTTMGCPVVGFDSSNGSLESVDVRHSGGGLVRYSAQGFILSTGGLIGGGINASRRGVDEDVLDLRVKHPDNRYEWFRDNQFGAHRFNKFGVETDQDLRPVDETGEVELSNLWLTGSVLGGFDSGSEKSGGGVSVASGYHSANKALEITEV